MQVEVVERWSWNVYMFAISLGIPSKTKKKILQKWKKPLLMSVLEKKMSKDKELVMEVSTQNSSYFKGYVDLCFPEVLDLSFS